MNDSKTVEVLDRAIRKAHGEGWDYVDLSIEDAREILEALRRDEPRVMTLEELHSDLWIWMEYPGEEEGYDNYIGYAYLEGRMFEDWWFLTVGEKKRLVCPLKSYGQVWRCWTSRPTPEQMRDTRWEEESE